MSYEQMQEGARAIRSRMHLNVQLALTFYVAAIVFFLSHPDQSTSVRWLSAAGFTIVALTVAGVVRAQARTLGSIHVIVANLEEAMDFHSAGAYGGENALYPPAASLQNLRGLIARSRLIKAYQFLIYGLAGFGVVVAFVAK
jgi:hypothetical protein